jgi:hypothetical protein
MSALYDQKIMSITIGPPGHERAGEILEETVIVDWRLDAGDIRPESVPDLKHFDDLSTDIQQKLAVLFTLPYTHATTVEGVGSRLGPIHFWVVIT